MIPKVTVDKIIECNSVVKIIKFVIINTKPMVIVIQQGTTKEKLELLLKKFKTKKGVNTKKYCGIIKLKESPMQIQKQLRNEWG